MDDRTLAALDASIAHWEQNLAAETVGETDCGADACALCCEFYTDRTEAQECVGCPVAEKTGRTLCHGSPYVKASSARKNWNFASAGAATTWRKVFRTAAQEEIDFLRSLRPVDK